MAITAPTPPKAPTAPVVPGARTSSSAASGEGNTVQENNNGADRGREFGVHVTISNPNQAGDGVQGAAGGERQGQSQAQAAPANTGNANNGNNSANQGENSTGNQAAEAVSQQARQDMVQQALGLNEKDSQQVLQQEQQAESPWPLPGNSFSGMSYIPFLIVFVAAFITFLLRNLSQKPKTPKAAREPATRRQTANQQRQAAVAKKQEEQDKGKGKHFEMRI